MNREYLKGLGLEEDAINGIMAEHGKTINATKEQLESVTTERDDLKGQIGERDEQLDALSKVDAEGMQAEIKQLKEDNEAKAVEYQESLSKKTFDYSLERALTGAKVKNAKAVRALLDTEKIKLDGDTLLNLDDQLTALKESDGYLFDVEVEQEKAPDPSPQIVPPGNPNGGSNPDGDPFAAKMAKYK